MKMGYSVQELRTHLSSIAEKFDNDLYSLRVVISFLGVPENTISDLFEYLDKYQEEKTLYKRQLCIMSTLNEEEQKTLELISKYNTEHGLNMASDNVMNWIP